eukprot:874527-Amphidinium_carterae.1
MHDVDAILPGWRRSRYNVIATSAPESMHGRNTIASSVVRRRAAEAVTRSGLKIADVIWPDETGSTSNDNGFACLAKDALRVSVIML